MFTGIITAQGRIVGVEERDGVRRFVVDSAYQPEGVAIGASIAHNGVCLTVVEKALAGEGMRHVVDAAAETLEKTTAAQWAVGSTLNLERALCVGEELGGHIVSGHVDGVGRMLSRAEDGEGVRMRFSAPEQLMPLIAPKGSIVIDGVSLTVNEVDAEGFGVLIIPHTLVVTTLSALQPGDGVNLEADMLARYAQRILNYRPGA